MVQQASLVNGGRNGGAEASRAPVPRVGLKKPRNFETIYQLANCRPYTSLAVETMVVLDDGSGMSAIPDGRIMV